jgi:hypothetical protein
MVVPPDSESVRHVTPHDEKDAPTVQNFAPADRGRARHELGVDQALAASAYRSLVRASHH